MIQRALSMACGLAMAAGFSQYPEFSQQYVQRLAGQVEALEAIAADFDESAARSGLTREAALAEMTGTAFLADRQADMTRAFTRLETLRADRAMLGTATPVERIFMPQRLRDAELLAGTWADFEPGLPLTPAGAVSAGLGFVLGAFGAGGVLAALGALIRRRPRPRPRPQAPQRIEPRVTTH